MAKWRIEVSMLVETTLSYAGTVMEFESPLRMDKAIGEWIAEEVATARVYSKIECAYCGEGVYGDHKSIDSAYRKHLEYCEAKEEADGYQATE